MRIRFLKSSSLILSSSTSSFSTGVISISSLASTFSSASSSILLGIATTIGGKTLSSDWVLSTVTGAGISSSHSHDSSQAFTLQASSAALAISFSLASWDSFSINFVSIVSLMIFWISSKVTTSTLSFFGVSTSFFVSSTGALSPVTVLIKSTKSSTVNTSISSCLPLLSRIIVVSSCLGATAGVITGATTGWTTGWTALATLLCLDRLRAV